MNNYRCLYLTDRLSLELGLAHSTVTEAPDFKSCSKSSSTFMGRDLYKLRPELLFHNLDNMFENEYVSLELCSLLKLNSDEKYFRSSITRLMARYLTSNNLINARAGGKLIINRHLEPIFGDAVDVTVFTMQTHLNRHYSSKSFLPTLPNIDHAQRRINDEMQNLFFDMPAIPGSRTGSLAALGGPRFQEVQKTVRECIDDLSL